ncbi:MAG: Gfo/Idh/MocA family protein [Hyphomicrobiaceae bacterium]
MKTGPSPPRFAIIGVAGYIARRHIDAIRQIGGDIVAAYDVSDSVGQINDFAQARFFTEFAEFSSYVHKAALVGRAVDYVVICSPNYLHRAHIEFALRAGAHAICEKPLVLNPWELNEVADLSKATGKKVFTILQLRLNPDNQQLRDEFAKRLAFGKNARIEGDLTYVTARSQWYYASWKGDERKSGGVATNIGVHFYDLLTYFFGRPIRNVVHHRAIDCAAGLLEFEGALIRYFLSINGRDLPAEAHGQKELNKATRRLVMGDRVCDLSGDFTRLHLLSYEEILSGRGFELETARPAIEIVSAIRAQRPEADAPDRHPLVGAVLADIGRYEDGIPV